eukprot:1287796-Rhodomonas_salina.1
MRRYGTVGHRQPAMGLDTEFWRRHIGREHMKRLLTVRPHVVFLCSEAGLSPPYLPSRPAGRARICGRISTENTKHGGEIIGE